MIAATSRGVCAVLVGQGDKLLMELLHREFPRAVLTRLPAASGAWSAAVESCRDEDPLLCELPLELRRGIFQARVWKALQ